MKMKRILVTGASGFLGGRIIEFYKEKYDVYAPNHHEMDIINEESVINVLSKYQPDVVIHCAAVSNSGLCEKEPERTWRINVDGSIHVAKASAQIGAKCIICSSDQVYLGTPAEGAHREEEAVQPLTVYGKQKRKAEQECLKVNPECVLLRLSWMYDIRTLKEEEHGDFIRTLLPKLQSTENLTYPVHDFRGLTDVNEVVQNMEKVFEIDGGVYNFGSPNEKNTYEMMISLFSGIGEDTGRIKENTEAYAENPRNIAMNQEKINSCGIVFSSTVESLVRNVKAALAE